MPSTERGDHLLFLGSSQSVMIPFIPSLLLSLWFYSCGPIFRYGVVRKALRPPGGSTPRRFFCRFSALDPGTYARQLRVSTFLVTTFPRRFNVFFCFWPTPFFFFSLYFPVWRCLICFFSIIPIPRVPLFLTLLAPDVGFFHHLFLFLRQYFAPTTSTTFFVTLSPPPPPRKLSLFFFPPDFVRTSFSSPRAFLPSRVTFIYPCFGHPGGVLFLLVVKLRHQDHLPLGIFFFCCNPPRMFFPLLAFSSLLFKCDPPGFFPFGSFYQIGLTKRASRFAYGSLRQFLLSRNAC